MTNSTDHWLNLLEKSGCRITAPRRTIIEILLNTPRALEPVEIYDIGRQLYPGIGLVTIYRTLDKLEELGLVQRVHRDDGCHMVMKAAVGHQHYLVCTQCGATTLFKGDNMDPLIARVEETTGFCIQDHWLQLLGVCPACSNARNPE